MNQILNDAIKAYLHRQGEEERRLEESLQYLRSYRERDPEFQQAIATVAAAEAGEADPLEGVLVQNAQGDHPSRRKAARTTHAVSTSSSAPGRSRLRTLLNA